MYNDFREEFLTKVMSAFSVLVSDVDLLSSIRDILIIEMDKYELSERCTDLALRDNTAEELMKLYAGSILSEGMSRNTVESYIKTIRKFHEDVEKQFDNVSAFDVRVWLAKRQQDISLRTCENNRSYLSAFYTWLTNEGFIDSNPMSKIKPIKYTKEIELPFDTIEVDKLRSSCTTLRQRAELELLLSSGIRVSEMCSLDISDVNFSSNEIMIRKGKGGKQRIVYMDDVCCFHLKKYVFSRKDRNTSLFVSRSKERLAKRSVENDLHKIGYNASVENVHPHRCRRTFASNMAKSGMDIRTIQMLMGHSNLNTTMLYITYSTDHIKNQYQKYS